MQAMLYEAPFEYVNTHVRPTRVNNRRALYANNWWWHMEPRPGMRRALEGAIASDILPHLELRRKHRFVLLAGTADIVADQLGDNRDCQR